MPAEKEFTDFSLPRKDQSFLIRYSTPYENVGDHMEARSMASTFGQIIETVAAGIITEPIKLGERRRSKLKSDLNSITKPLTDQVKSVHVTDGKTLSRAQVLPFYTNIFETHCKEIDRLTSEMDKVHGINLSEKLAELRQPPAPEMDQLTFRTRMNYFIDGLIILSKLTLDGIGENLKPFGNLVPDIKLREKDNGNSQVTQFDGLFLSKKIEVPYLESPSEREEFIRSLAVKSPEYPYNTPPVLEVPAFLEIKSHFRPRWSIGNLSQHIPPYYMRQIMQHIGKAFTEADLAIAPRSIIYLRLRSLAPNSIAIEYTGLEFYRRWREAIESRFITEHENGIPDYFHGKIREQLGTFLGFLVNHEAKLEAELEGRTNKRGGDESEKSSHASQSDLFDS